MKHMENYKNALPEEVDDHPRSSMPRQLRTTADKERPLSRREAEIAGLIGAERDGVYGESSAFPNEEDQREAHQEIEP